MKSFFIWADEFEKGVLKLQDKKTQDKVSKKISQALLAWTKQLNIKRKREEQ